MDGVVARKLGIEKAKEFIYICIICVYIPFAADRLIVGGGDVDHATAGEELHCRRRPSAVDWVVGRGGRRRGEGRAGGGGHG